MNKKIKILHLEDSLRDSELIQSLIESGGIVHDYFLAENEKEYLQILEKENIDIILSDYTLPVYSGDEALKFAREKHSSIPFIFISGTIGEDAAIKSMLNGASDYVMKNKLERLVPAINRTLHEYEIERKNIMAEKALEKSEKKFRSYIENAPDGVFVVDNTGRYIETNTAVCNILGYSDVEMLKFSIRDLLADESLEDCINHFNKLIETGEAISDLRHIHKDGSKRWLTINALKLSETRFLGFAKDITKRKEAEKELIEAKEKAEESDRLKTNFLANMSHEIRTPMNGILGFTELLKEPGLTGEQQKEFIAIIEKSGERLLNIINDIINISKVESHTLDINISITNINQQLDYLIKLFKPEADNKGLKLIYYKALSSSEAFIKTDREKFYAILTNLIKNAIKYTKTGFIEIGYILKPASAVNELEFYVKDSGMGIQEEKKELIFERFRQASEGLSRSHEGAGLGLSISKAYVEMLGGSIWLESEFGKGSTFFFSIPYIPKFENEIEIDKTILDKLDIHHLSKLKILVVEDDEASEKLIKNVVEKLSKEVLFARNGIEAVDACHSNPDIDIILMDIQMPLMNGYVATKEIRAFNKTVIIIAQTAFAMPGDKEKAIEVGCNEHISKPINLKKMNCLIKKYF